MASVRTVVVAVVLALVAGACSAGDRQSDVSPSETPFVDLPLEQATDRFLDDPYEVAGALLADRLGQTGDPGYVPHLVDLLRFGSTDDLAVRAGEALASLTGIPRPDDQREAYVTYGTWLDTNEVEPADGYLDWKARLLGDVDPAFEELLGQVDDPLLAARLQWGGVIVGGIPELNDPDVLSAEEARFMTDDEVVFGTEVNGDARAYPLRILGHHELANDHLGGAPVAMTFCTLCRTALLFDRRVDGQTLTFRTSGLLLRSNKVMVDSETQTLWEQLTGRGLAGEHEGRQLDRYLVTTTDWADWRDQHPGTDVLDIPDPDLPSDDRPYHGGYSYEPGDAYRSYFESEDVWFPGLDTPEVLPRKAEVLTVTRDGDALAVSVEELQREGPAVLDLADGWILALPTSAGGRLYLGEGARPAEPDPASVTDDEAVLPDGRRLARADHAQSFWFAWHARHPDSRVWPHPSTGS